MEVTEDFDMDTYVRQTDLLTEPQRPKIITLCGSTRYHDEFVAANYKFTMEGAIVLSVGFYPHSPGVHGEGVGATADEKIALDELHKRKIDLSDEIYVINKDGYVGDSTRSEIAYARRKGVGVRWLEIGQP